MTLILSALLFSIASNLDNLVIGMAYGIKKLKIDIFKNLIIATVTTMGTFLSMSVGIYISRLLPKSFSNILGALAIIALGLYFLIESVLKLKNNKSEKELALKDIADMISFAEASDLDHSGDISTKEALLVAISLTLNNLGTGVAASVTGVNFILTTLFTFIFSILTIVIGQNLGNSIFGKLFGKYAPLISGLLLIILGVIEILN